MALIKRPAQASTHCQLRSKTSRLRHGAHQPSGERLGRAAPPQAGAFDAQKSLLSFRRQHHRDSVLVRRCSSGHELREKDPGGGA